MTACDKYYQTLRCISVDQLSCYDTVVLLPTSKAQLNFLSKSMYFLLKNCKLKVDLQHFLLRYYTASCMLTYSTEYVNIRLHMKSWLTEQMCKQCIDQCITRQTS